MKLTMFDGYFESTTIHGFSYMKSDNSYVTRLFWVTIVITGLAISGNLISQLFTDWDENPTIITLGSVQAPVSDIQFPTITLCEQPDGPVQNWVYPEKALNAIGFECYPPPDWYAEYGVEPNYPTCNGTAQLFREDFKWIPKYVHWHFRTPLLEGNYDFVTVDTRLNDTEVDMALEIMSNRTDFIDYLKASVEANFGHANTFEDFITEMWNNEGGDGERANVTDATLAKLKAHLTTAKIMLSAGYDKNLGFGTLLSMFENVFMRGPTSKCRFYNLERKLHQLMVNLTQTLGFNTTVDISLYDIPPMVSFLSDDRFAYDQVIEEQFRYTRCQLTAKTGNYYDTGNLWSCKDRWEERATLNKTHPCDEENVYMDGLCCNGLTNALGQDLPRIMHVMRVSSKPANIYFDRNAIVEPFVNSTFIKYHMNPMDKGYYRAERYSKFEATASIRGCRFDGLPNDTVKFDTDCKLFQPVVTDMGVCYSFNSPSSLDILQPTYFKETFINEYGPEIKSSENFTIMNGVGAGPLLGLKLILYNTPFFKPSRLRPKKHGEIRRKKVSFTSFSIGISSANELLQMRATGKTPRTGFKTTYEVYPSELISTESLKGIPIEKRNCLFENEGEGYIEMFKNYSQAGCQFECMAKLATSICRCTPWNTPFIGNATDHIVCDVFGRTCHDLVMNQQYRTQACNCPPDCKNLQFTVLTKEEELDPIQYCTGGFSEPNAEAVSDAFRAGYNDIFYAKYNLEHGYKTFEMNPSRNYFFRKNALESAICEQYIKSSIAEVSITFGSGRYTRTIMDKKVHFSDQLGSFGGTLGLFTGMSVLSMVEAIYWIIRMARNCLAPPKRKRQD